MPITSATVDLKGIDGNAMSIIAAARKALRAAGHGDKIDAFSQAAISGDYDNVLSTVGEYMHIAWGADEEEEAEDGCFYCGDEFCDEECEDDDY